MKRWLKVTLALALLGGCALAAILLSLKLRYRRS